MKVAAYQSPLLPEGSMHVLDLIRAQVGWCEEEGIPILCCPEAILGGLADFSDNPERFAIRTGDGQLASILTPLASETVIAIVGFTELGPDGALYNAAAVFERGRVAGLYRKIHPAIRRSVYRSGSDIPVFRAGQLTFGIVICRYSNYPELAGCMAVQNAAVVF